MTPHDTADPQLTVAEIADRIAERDFVVAPMFLATSDVEELASDAQRLCKSDAFRRAGVGRGRDLQLQPEVRSDWVCWLDTATATPAISRYLGLIEDLRRAVNERMLLGVLEFEGHLAIYPAGAFYRRHLDRFRTAHWRSLSLILYLNSDWLPEDGGALRLELGDQGGGKTLEVLPAGGTLVAFLSERVWHEVLPARRDRLSLTGWLTTRH